MLRCISIIVPCRNEARHLPGFLGSLANQLLPENCEGEVIIADGMSTDGTRAQIMAFAENFPQAPLTIRLIDNPQGITPTALNAALHVARGEVIIRMDVHSEYANDYVAQCIKTLDETGADNVGGPARTKFTSPFQEAAALAQHSPFSTGGARFHDVNYRGKLDTVTYGCWHRSVFERLGYFDEELVRNQDDEFNLRITRAGGTIWQAPEIQSWLYPRSSFLTLFRQQQQYGYWKVRVIQKHKIPASVRHLVPGAFVGLVMVLSALSFFSVYARGLLVFLLGIYIAINACVSFDIAERTKKWSLTPKLIQAFAAYHFGYGYGFLRGMIDFMWRKRGASAQFTQQTHS